MGHALGITHPDQGASHGDNFYYFRDVSDLAPGAVPSRTTPPPPPSSLEALYPPPPPRADGGGRVDLEAKLKINCTHPWAHVRRWPNASAAADVQAQHTAGDVAFALELQEQMGFPHWGTIMATFTFNNPSTCIFQDDLDALNVLYPVCENAVLRPQCDQPKTYLGHVRLAFYVGVPVLFLLGLMIGCHSLSIWCAHRAAHSVCTPTHRAPIPYTRLRSASVAPPRRTRPTAAHRVPARSVRARGAPHH